MLLPKYCIQVILDRTYLKLDKRCGVSFVSDCEKSTMFDTRSKAENYIANNMPGMTGLTSGDVVILEYFNGEQKSVVECPDLDVDTAAACLERLMQAISDMGDMVILLRQVNKYYALEQQRIDLAQEDLLHKIEFTKAGAVEGYKLYKRLHELRIHRREIKDVMDRLKLIADSNLLGRMEKLTQSIAGLDHQCEARVYRPRVLTDLFLPSPSPAPEPAPDDSSPEELPA